MRGCDNGKIHILDSYNITVHSWFEINPVKQTSFFSLTLIGSNGQKVLPQTSHSLCTH